MSGINQRQPGKAVSSAASPTKSGPGRQKSLPAYLGGSEMPKMPNAVEFATTRRSSPGMLGSVELKVNLQRSPLLAASSLPASQPPAELAESQIGGRLSARAVSQERGLSSPPRGPVAV